MRRKTRPKSTITILMPEELKAQLTALAAASSRNRSAYVRQILRRYIQYMETKNNPDGPAVDWDI